MEVSNCAGVMYKMRYCTARNKNRDVIIHRILSAYLFDDDIGRCGDLAIERSYIFVEKLRWKYKSTPKSGRFMSLCSAMPVLGVTRRLDTSTVIVIVIQRGYRVGGMTETRQNSGWKK